MNNEMTDYDVEMAYYFSNEIADEAAREVRADFESEMAYQDQLAEENHSAHVDVYDAIQGEKLMKELQRKKEIQLYGRAFS